MAYSKRLEIMKKLTSLIETRCNGQGCYTYNLDEKVFRGRTVFGDDAPIPCVSILEAKSPNYGQAADENGTIRKTGWTLLVQGWISNDEDMSNETDKAYELAEDVLMALNLVMATDTRGLGKPVDPEFYQLGGLITSLTIGDPVVRPSEIEVSSKAFFYLPIIIGISNTP